MTEDPPQESPPSRAWLRFRIGYVVILAAVVLFSVKFVQQTWQDDQLGRQLALVQTQHEAQLRGANVLRAQIRQYKTLSFVRQQARAWGYVKPGDQPVLIYYRNPAHAHHHRYIPQKRPRPRPVWLQWWQSFFGGSGH